MVDQTKFVDRFAPNPDIFRNAHRPHQIQLLMDHGDAILKRIERALQANINAAQFETARIGRVDASDDFHQSRFARTILTHQRVHRAAAQLKLHVIKRHHARKFLAHSIHFQNIIRAGNRTAFADNFHCGWADHGASH